jgi:Ohr subfamily peroxiredoxin
MEAIYTAEVTTKGNRDGGHAQSSDGKIDLDLNLPKELDGKGGPGTNPEQLFAAGYSACFGSAIAAMAGKAKLDASPIEVTAKVGLGKNEAGGFALKVKLECKLGSLSKEDATKIVEEAHKICPYSNATRNNVPVEIEVLN